MFEGLFKKDVPLLKPEDVQELRNLEREAYLKEAKKLISERGERKAKNDYGIKEVKKDPWQI